MRRKQEIKETKNVLASFLLVSLAAILAIFLGFKLYLFSLPPIANFDKVRPNPVSSIYSSDGEIIKTFTAYKFEKVDIEDIPTDLKNAFISVEDKNFYKHQGYDIFGLVRSTLVNISAGKVKQGASTITQQLARILFLSNERTFNRKIKELIIAHRIEKTIPKERILEMYLNAVYLGSGSYGVLGASKTYFDKELDELSLAEMALLAGLPQAPSVYSPFNNPDLAIKRRNQVLKRMYRTRSITKEQYDKALDEKLKLNKRPKLYSYNHAPYFVDYVIAELEKLGFDEQEISQGGLRVYTTVKYANQIEAQDAIAGVLKANKLTNDKNQAALFSFSPVTGKIFAYVGGKNYEKSQYDRVANAIRPPGSSFKPFVYAAALQQGLSPDDTLEDRKLQVSKDWSPKNYGGKYRGNIPAWLALAVSSNVCAVRLIQKVGVDAVISLAREMGISTPLQRDYTIALGSNGVKLYDITVAYGAFANGGFRVTPYAIERVESSTGKVIYQHESPKIAKVISFDTASNMTYMLKKVIEKGTGVHARLSGIEAAGKTGTTDDYRDAWFIGYTPNIVAGVWVGNDDNSKLPGAFTGGGAPARIWKQYMQVATKDYPKDAFDYSKDGEEIKTEHEDVGEVTEEVSEVETSSPEDEIPQTKPVSPQKNIQVDIPSSSQKPELNKPFNTQKPPTPQRTEQKAPESAPLPF